MLTGDLLSVHLLEDLLVLDRPVLDALLLSLVEILKVYLVVRVESFQIAWYVVAC